jgi:tRNA(adenine34) deaminase
VNGSLINVPDHRGHTLSAHPAFGEVMVRALEAARSAAESGDVPIGAAVLHMPIGGETATLAVAGNEREQRGDPTAHAEVLALRAAALELGRWRLDDCVLVVTLEPCPMCAGAAWAARIGGVVFGAVNTDAGATGSLYHLGQDPRLNHEFPTLGGVRAEECTDLLDSFFADRRPQRGDLAV